jgi:hypothetical protein
MVWSIFSNITFQDASSHGFYSPTVDGLSFWNCRFTNNGGAGILADDSMNFFFCEADNNAATGFDLDNSGTLLFCKTHDNGNHQIITVNSPKLVMHTLVYGLTSGYHGWNAGSLSTSSGIYNTFDGENISGVNGINYTASNDLASGRWFGNLFYDCNTGWKATNSLTNTEFDTFFAFNGYFSNVENFTSTLFTAAGSPYNGEGDVVGDPSFTDEAGDDYTLGSASPMVDAIPGPGLLS